MSITRFLYNISMTDGQNTKKIEKTVQNEEKSTWSHIDKEKEKKQTARLKNHCLMKNVYADNHNTRRKEKRQSNKSMISLNKYQEQLTTSM